MNSSTTCKYICSLLISLLCLSLQAQEQQPQQTQPQQKKEKAPLLSGVAVSADLVGFAMKAVGAKFANMEVGARLNLFDKYFPVAELGIGDSHREGAETGNTFAHAGAEALGSIAATHLHVGYRESAERNRAPRHLRILREESGALP